MGNSVFGRTVLKDYGGVNLFEGTTPAPAPREPTNESVAAPLAGVDPSDPGVDIGGLLKLTGGWKQIRWKDIQSNKQEK